MFSRLAMTAPSLLGGCASPRPAEIKSGSDGLDADHCRTGGCRNSSHLLSSASASTHRPIHRPLDVIKVMIMKAT